MFGESVSVELIATVVVVVAAVVFRLGVGRWVGSRNWATPAEGRRWLVRLSTSGVFVAVALLLLIWGDELRTAALSFVALAVAFVIATQDFIKAIQGSLLRAASTSFVIGDRVRIGDVRGIVIDHSLLVTTLLEIGPSHVRTGRTVVIPNSRLLSDIVHNETLGHEYVLHSFVVPVDVDEWERARDLLLEGATIQAEPYVAKAREQMEARARLYSLPMPQVDPFVMVGPAAKDTVALTVRFPVAAPDLAMAEDAIMQHWMTKSRGR